jgi:hypothetical protein
MLPRTVPMLVVVTGPIGSGKSTVCALLADRLVAAPWQADARGTTPLHHRRGQVVVGVDLDVVAEMVRAPGGLTDEHWELAHHVHGSLVGAWLRSPVDLVLAHGPIYTRAENEALMATVPTGTSVLRVLLLVSFATARLRVSADPTRGLSRDPEFLRSTYDRFASIRPTIEPCDLTVDTEKVPAESIAAEIVELILRRAEQGE